MAARVSLRGLEPGDGGWVIAQHGAVFADEEGYDASYEALVARVVADFLEAHDPHDEAGWIAMRGAEKVGCIFCIRQDFETAKLRLFLTVPEARHQGVGKSLLAACMDFARAKGYRRMVLWTHASHRAAGELYARTGWRLVSRIPGHQFGRDVEDQEWEVIL